MSDSIARARVLKYGDNVDTDVIIPARYLNTSDRLELARHCMEDIDPTFLTRVQPGSIMLVGKNFGCGSSREHAPVVIRENGVALVIAASFSRIFYRNALNIGLAIVECAQAYDEAEEGDEFSADLATGVLVNHTKDVRYEIRPLEPFIQQIIQVGGLAAFACAGGLD